MSDLSKRIAELSPDKRELLMQRMNQKKAKIAPTKIQRQSRDSHSLPLSFAQQRLWFLEQLDPGNPTYNIPAAVHLQGNLNVAALEESINEIIKRHEILRTSFVTIDGQPIQVIASELKLTLPVIDLQELTKTASEQVVQELITKAAQQPFDLTQIPLLRVSLLHLSPSENVVLFTMHHIISDGWSINILIQELTTLYPKFLHGKPSPLPELLIQYADFGMWQRQWLEGEVLETQINYWKQQLGGELPVLNLPTDKPRIAVQTSPGETQKFALSRTLTTVLIQLSQEQEATLYMVLLTAFNILLYRYTKQEDILIGSPIANRNQIETESLIGFFVNTLVMRTDLRGNLNFCQLLARVREVALAAYAHQDLPFEKLVDELQTSRHLGYTPLFQVMFALQNAPRTSLNLPGLTLKSLEVKTNTAKFDLSLFLTNTEEGLRGTFEYNTDLFQPATIARMVEHFQILLAGIVANPQEKLSQLPLLSQQEKHQLLIEWNNTAGNNSPDVLIHQLFEAQVEKTPDAVAVIFENQQLTYRELNQRANKLAHYLQKLGVKPEVLVGICVERSLNMLIGLLAILKAGGAYIPLDPNYPQERLGFILADTQVPVLLTQASRLAALPEHQGQTICLDTNWHLIEQQSPENICSQITAENLAYVIYTSGSTGKPKGVQISHRALNNFLFAMQQSPGITEEDTLLAVTTYSFDIAALELFLPIIVGARLVIVSREVAADGIQLSAALTNSQATLMQATPATWQLLLAAGWGGNQQLKILCGGEALPAHLANQLRERCASLWNMYGPTETTIWSAAAEVKTINRTVTISQPITNTQIYILDRYHQLVPVGVPGQVCIAGDGLARGYFHRPDLTAEKFIPHPFSDKPSARLYQTGDLARYLSKGEIEYIGRIDHQVKIRGFRIELGEIEAVLNRDSGIQEAVVIVREDHPGNKYLAAYIVPVEDMTLAIAQLRHLLKAQLPEYMVPDAFVILEALPLTPNGKINRQALPAPKNTRLDLQNSYVPPRTPVEEILVSIWSQVLNQQQVEIYNNFFELGGHSLLATQVISRVYEAFNVELPLRYLFESPTVADLALHIDQLISHTKDGLRVPPMLPRQPNQELTLSFAQQRLWFLEQLQPGNSAYNISTTVRLSGVLNVEILTHSISEIISRHEALRTIFTTMAGQPVPVIIPSPNFTLPIIDLRKIPLSARETEAIRLAKEEFRRPFDLTEWPLLRVSLLQLNTAEYVLILTMHHIISDLWSMGILIQELVTLYKTLSDGKSSPLPSLPIQYADFAIWQQEWLQGEVFQAQLSYWKQQLGHNLPILKLPTDRPRVDVSTSKGATYSFWLSPKLYEDVKTLSLQEGVTLFMTLLAAFETLLNRYTGQDDIVVGTDVANRNSAKTEGLIGFFVNLLVLRTNLSGNPSFREVLKRVREVALGAYAHQDLPFAKLVEELRPDRSASSTPLFQVLFVLQNVPMPTVEVSGLQLTSMEIDNELAKFDLALFLTETESGIVGNWKYNADLFDASTIIRISEHFAIFLQSIIAQPDARINSLEILTEMEKKQKIMTQVKQEESKLKKFMQVKPKAIKLPEGELIETNYLQPDETLPLVIKPAVEQIDLIDWVKSNHKFIETKLSYHGALLFRGFKVESASAFEKLAQAICPELFGEYGDLPREGLGGKVYGSTPYPADQAILFHNESSHLHCWPLKIWFFCLQSAQAGGETPIVDCRKVYQLLNPKLRSRFQEKKLMYVRNYTKGLDVSWQEFFHTTDRTLVENYCRQEKIAFEWKEDDNLLTRQVRPAVTQHPQTGELVFFNQIQLHHVSCLEPAVRDSLLSTFGEEKLPRNVYYGDGSPIEDAVVEEIRSVYEQATVSFPWQEGDVLMLDNMLTAHGRNSYVGPRKILVAMGEMHYGDSHLNEYKKF